MGEKGLAGQVRKLPMEKVFELSTLKQVCRRLFQCRLSVDWAVALDDMQRVTAGLQQWRSWVGNPGSVGMVRPAQQYAPCPEAWCSRSTQQHCTVLAQTCNPAPCNDP